jgi:predicted outer membrane repeat protein
VFDLTTGGVTLADLTVQNGRALGAPGNGAGIRGTSGLTLNGVQVLSNTAQTHGGGLYLNGDLVINGGLFRNNHGTNGVGGGLYNLGMTTISSTSFLSNTAWYWGGALVSSGDLLVSGGLFQANRCTDLLCDGGGLYGFSQATLTGTQFLGNTAQYLGGGAFVSDDLTVINGLFQGNQAVLGYGGGLYASSVTIQGTQFLSNTARSRGGGIYSAGSLTVTHGVFAHNQTIIASGGGVFAGGAVLVSGTLFLRNAAAEGGALSHASGDGRIANSLFAGNQATNGVGEALLLGPGGRVDVLHNTLAGTGAPGGAAIEVLTGTVGITNTLITRHTVGISNTGGVVSQDYNLFFGIGTRTLGLVAGGAHSFSGNPLFAAPWLDDYHLSPGSAAIDAGTNAGVAVDFEGEARPQNHGYDIGYDEILIAPEFWMYLPAVRK